MSNILFIEGLHKHIDLAGNFIMVSALAVTTYYWALEQFAQGSFILLDFTIKKYAPVYTKIEGIFCSISKTLSYVSFIQW